MPSAQATPRAPRRSGRHGAARGFGAGLVAALAALTGLGAAPGAVAATAPAVLPTALPSGTTPLATGASAYPVTVTPLARLGDGFLVHGTDWPRPEQAWKVGASGSATAVPASPTVSSWYSCSDVAAGVATDPGTGTRTVAWRASDGATGARALAATRSLVGGAPGGWIEQDEATKGLRRITADGGAETTLAAALPGYVDDVVCDSTSYAFVVASATGATVYRGSFGSGAPTALTTQTTGADAFLTVRTLAVRGTAVGYAVSRPGGTTLMRTGAGTPTTVSTGGFDPLAVLLTADATYAAGVDADGCVVLRTPLGGTSAAVAGTRHTNDWCEGLFAETASGPRYVAPGSPLGGLYVVTSTGFTRNWTPPLAHLEAGAIGLSAGRVVWTDNRRLGGVAWSRVLRPASLDPEVYLAGHAGGGGVFGDGRRTTWEHDESGLLTIHAGLSGTRPGLGMPLAMSGHRVLHDGLDDGDTPGVLDLSTGTSTTIPGAQAMWGGTVYRLDATAQTIIARTLATGSESTVRTAAQAGLPAGATFTGIDAQGDLVAWSWSAPGSAGAGWRNTRTAAQGALPMAGVTALDAVRVHGRYLATVAYLQTGDVRTQVVDVPAGTVVFTRLDSAATAPDEAVRTIALGPAGLAWISRAGTPYLTRLADQQLPPRHEGNPLITSTVALNGSLAWKAELVFTEPLTACSIVITSAAGATVATVPCTAPQGEVMLSWNGTDASGSAVPAGTYTWRLVGGDADGSVVDVAGSGSVGGTVVVPPQNPNIAFVKAAYQDFLGRPPTTIEQSMAVTNLTAGFWSRESFLRKLANSNEWLGVIVRKMYRDTLGREPDAAGLAAWVELIRGGRYTVAGAAAYFYSSDEFYKGLGGADLTTWVTKLYERLLLRAPEAGGLTYWVSYAANPSYGRYWVAARFHDSPESRLTRVKNLYQALLKRLPDPSGALYWATVVQTKGDIELAVSLATSAEYAQKAAVRYP